jgi:hypothetical protein
MDLQDHYICGRSYKLSYANVNRDLSYLVSTNCQIRLQEGKTVTMRGDELLKSEEDFLVDNRLRLVSFETVSDITTYLNYFELFSRISDREVSRPEVTGRYVAMLDMGYVPIVAAPSFMSEEMYNQFLPVIKMSAIDHRELKPMRIDGRGFDAKADDIWGSRIDMAEYLKCSLSEVKPLTFLFEVMKRCK